MLLRSLILIFLIKSSRGFITGAGTSACVTMTPSHNNVESQITAMPVSMTPSVTNVMQGQTMTFVLEGIQTGYLFRGFIARAQSLAEDPQVLGSFVITEGMRTVQCPTMSTTAVATHTSAEQKTRIELTWVAPTEFSGIINMHFSVVESLEVFWTGGQSSFVLISAPPPATVPPPVDGINVFEGCGEEKVCFGAPTGCIETENCRLFGAVSFKDEKFYFELLSKPGVAYAAIALSENDQMPDSSVIECANIDGSVVAFTSFTEGRTLSSREDIDQSVIRLETAQIVNGEIYCRVERDAVTTVRGRTFDLLNERHFLLLASGMVLLSNGVGPHTLPAATSEALWLNPNPPDSSPPFDVYDGCGTIKICYGSPSGCLQNRNCRLFGAVIFAENRFFFELLSKANVAYIAFGLSDDENMADSSVIECVNTESTVKAYTSYTEGREGSPRTDINQTIIQLITGQAIDGRIYCLVERNVDSVVRGRRFDLFNDKYHLLLAQGETVLANSVGPHSQPSASGERVRLTVPRNLEESERVLILVHGSLMIVAWVGLTSIGIFLARYFKRTWENQSICGNKAWFFWHFLCMVLTFILTIASVIIIFVEIGEWRTSVHAVTGIIVTAFVVFQPIGAVFRPAPTSKNRPIFNFLHFSFGNITHVLAFITIFYAVPLVNARLPQWTSYVLIGFVVMYLLMHVLLTTIRVIGEIKREQKLGSSKGAPFLLLNKTLLGFFVLATLLFVIALVCIVVIPGSS